RTTRQLPECRHTRIKDSDCITPFVSGDTGESATRRNKAAGGLPEHACGHGPPAGNSRAGSESERSTPAGYEEELGGSGFCEAGFRVGGDYQDEAPFEAGGVAVGEPR